MTDNTDQDVLDIDGMKDYFDRAGDHLALVFFRGKVMALIQEVERLMKEIEELKKERGELKDCIEAQRVGYLDSVKKLEALNAELKKEIDNKRKLLTRANETCQSYNEQNAGLKATLERERKHHKFDKENPF